jgi:hypothetical protein
VPSNELERPPSLLVAALFERAQQLGHTGKDLAKCLGVSAGHLRCLRSGVREAQNIKPELVTAAAAGLPRARVMHLAGQIGPEDFGRMSVETQVARAVAFILSDPEWGIIAPRELHNSSSKLKGMAIEMYEAATGYKLLIEPKEGVSRWAVKLASLAQSEPAPAMGPRKQQEAVVRNEY